MIRLSTTCLPARRCPNLFGVAAALSASIAIGAPQAGNGDAPAQDPIPAVEADSLSVDVDADPLPPLTPTRTEQSIENLRRLARQRTKIEEELLAASDADAAELQRRLAQIDAQIQRLAAGVSETDYRGDDDGQFDLNSEVQSLLEPFVAVMKDATENAREIERLRREIAELRKRQTVAQRAIESIDPIRAAADANEDRPLIDTLDEMTGRWQDRAQESSDLASALEQQLQERLEDRGNTREAASEAASSFFRERGLSMLLGFLAFALTMALMKLAHAVIIRVRGLPARGRTFRMRLFDLVFTVLTLVSAIGAALLIFNLRHDWMLLGACTVLLLAAAWIALKMAPGAVEQVTMLLNLGAVQEGERVLFEGIPYRVEKLDFYSNLDNPALDGAHITLPVRALIGLHSRPAGPSEPWFPTKKGDWVMLADGVRGRVLSQSPETVELEVPGKSHLTYTTGAFLGGQPKNLSGGFRVETTFGIGYVHQADATDAIMSKLRKHVEAGLNAMLPDGQVKRVSVELLEAADSAIVYEIEADLSGAAAPRYQGIERELARLCVDACNVHKWEIPFPQMVLHGKLPA